MLKFLSNIFSDYGKLVILYSETTNSLLSSKTFTDLEEGPNMVMALTANG